MKFQFFIFFILFTFFQPSYGGVLILNGLTHVHKAHNGEVIKGEIVLLNTGQIDERITFNLNDILLSCGNKRTFTDLSTHSRSSNNWFQANMTDKVLRPNEKFIYHYEIQVPAEKTVKGTHWSALMVEVENAIKEEQIEDNFHVESKIRYAIGIITNVQKFEAFQIEFENIEYKDSSPENKTSIEVNLQNPSNFLEIIQLQLEIYDEEGKKVFQTKSPKKRIFPGSCSKFQLDLSTLPKGTYECLLLAESRNEYVGANLNLVRN